MTTNAPISEQELEKRIEFSKKHPVPPPPPPPPKRKKCTDCFRFFCLKEECKN
jgi:hypothetical protein